MGPGFGHCPESRRRRIRRRKKFLTLDKERAPVRKKSARREEKTEIQEGGEGGSGEEGLGRLSPFGPLVGGVLPPRRGGDAGRERRWKVTADGRYYQVDEKRPEDEKRD